VNESGGDQITELLNDNLQLTESDNLDATDDGDEDSPARTGREGLPRTFRMRHDAHYVDELMSRTMDGPGMTDREDMRRRPTQPPAAPERVEIRTSVPPAPQAAAAPALALIAERLEAIAAHGGALRTHHASSFIEQSIQVEFARVTRLARAAAILQNAEPPMRGELSARDIVDGTIRAGGPVARLAGMEFDASMDDAAFAILAEPAMVVQGIAGTVDAVVDLLLSDPRRRPAVDARHPAARISISLQTVRVRPAIILDVFCPTLFVSGSHAERFFDNAADDYRAAPAAGILLAAAAHIVRAHGGRADVKRHSATGATITYVFPQSGT